MVLGFNHFDVDATSIFYGLPLIIYITIFKEYIIKKCQGYSFSYNMAIHISFETLEYLKRTFL